MTLWFDSASHLCRYRWTHQPSPFVGEFWGCSGAVHASRALCWCHHLSHSWWGQPPKGNPEALLCQAENKSLCGKGWFCLHSEQGKVCTLLPNVSLTLCRNAFSPMKEVECQQNLCISYWCDIYANTLVVLWQFNVVHIVCLCSLFLLFF